MNFVVLCQFNKVQNRQIYADKFKKISVNLPNQLHLCAKLYKPAKAA